MSAAPEPRGPGRAARDRARTRSRKWQASAKLWQTAGAMGGGGSGVSGLVPAVITSNVTAGTEASPTTFTFNSELASGNGFTTTGGISGGTAYNRFAGVSFSASGGSPVSCWLMQRSDGNYYLVSADC